MTRLIITGANGTGKSHTALRLAKARPDLPVISFDALRLTENWNKRPAREVDAALSDVVAQEAWILEGGPSLIAHALSRCDGVIWLDPPDVLRAWRLALRPWKSLGRSRAEVPQGNVDWPLQQYSFALRSLWKSGEFRDKIQSGLQARPPPRIWRCRHQAEVEAAINEISRGGSR